MSLLNKVLTLTAAVSMMSSAVWAQATADVDIVLLDNFPSGYYIDSFTPASAEIGPTGIANTNPTILLRVGTRYHITYANGFAHPFQVAALGATPAADVILLSQGPTAGSLEADPGVAWLDNGPDFYFTVTAELVTALGATPGYRCEPHPDVMRGQIEIGTEPPPPPTPSADISALFNSVTQTCRQTRRGTSCRVSVDISLANIGDVKSLPTDIQVYVSDDQVVDGADFLLRSLRCPALNPGQTKSRKSRVRLPAGTTATGKFIIAVVNASDAVPETNKANNTVANGPLP